MHCLVMDYALFQCLVMYVRMQKSSGRQSLGTGFTVSESWEAVRQTSVTSPEPSFVMLRKLVEEADSKFVVTHEEVTVQLMTLRMLRLFTVTSHYFLPSIISRSFPFILPTIGNPLDCIRGLSVSAAFFYNFFVSFFIFYFLR